MNLKRPRDLHDSEQETPIAKKVCKEPNYLVICLKCGDHVQAKNAEFSSHFNTHVCNSIVDSFKIKTCISTLVDCLTGTPRPVSSMPRLPPPPPPPPPMLEPIKPVYPVESAKQILVKENTQQPCFLDELSSVILYV